MSDFRDIVSHFNINTQGVNYGDGHINDTYLIDMTPDKYILQKINTNIFKNPAQLMENIASVTGFMTDIIKKDGGDASRETLSLVKTTEGKNYYISPDGGCYRMYVFVENTVTHQFAENPKQFYNAAKAFGLFQKRLSAFPADKLYETIPDFHDTEKRFYALEKAVSEDICGRKKEVEKEIDFAFSRKSDTPIIINAIKSGEIPLRVTHNDTKLNNVLFDRETDEAICVIDLDTVMPGSLLYDYGDSIRFGASSGAEDEKDLDKIFCRMDYFEAFTKGFLEAIGSDITKKEMELLPFSAKIMTYECGIRFLTDYLRGDTYFKIHYPGQNLDRARTQFKLVGDMEEKFSQMSEIVKNCR